MTTNSDQVACPHCGGVFSPGEVHAIPRLLTPEAAAKLCGFKTAKRIYDLISSGSIPPSIVRRFGRQKRLLEEGFAHWIRETQTG